MRCRAGTSLSRGLFGLVVRLQALRGDVGSIEPVEALRRVLGQHGKGRSRDSVIDEINALRWYAQ